MTLLLVTRHIDPAVFGGIGPTMSLNASAEPRRDLGERDVRAGAEAAGCVKGHVGLRGRRAWRAARPSRRRARASGVRCAASPHRRIAQTRDLMAGLGEVDS
jgi:hypothetical protein